MKIFSRRVTMEKTRRYYGGGDEKQGTQKGDGTMYTVKVKSADGMVRTLVVDASSKSKAADAVAWMLFSWPADRSLSIFCSGSEEDWRIQTRDRQVLADLTIRFKM